MGHIANTNRYKTTAETINPQATKPQKETQTHKPRCSKKAVYKSIAKTQSAPTKPQSATLT
ncbi:MAG: hypothetical protein M1540_00415 [Candidatus Bathyarchaeota archaeon]|nr:hypothetical protein [Candidatus Bathyarchaeota archaeon]